MSQQATPVRVLVIDDDSMTRELLCMLLEVEGYEVSSAISGDAALAQLGAGQTTPDVVLTDMQMPGIAGAQLADALRAACGWHPLLLAMSGSTPADAEIAGFDGFVSKPFSMQELTAALSAARAARPPSAPDGPHDFPVESPESHMQVLNGNDPEDLNRRPALDENIFAQLRKSIPGPQLHQMYAMCVDDARERIIAMRGLAARRDGAQFIRQAHAIKGGTGMLGATEIYELASQLEAFGLNAPDLDGVKRVNPFDRLETACDRLERILGSRV